MIARLICWWIGCTFATRDDLTCVRCKKPYERSW